MASIYKRTDRKPIPTGAKLTQSAKPIPGNAAIKNGVAAWTDRNGRNRTALVQGDRVLIQLATWTGENGQTTTAPVDHTGEQILVVGAFYTAAYIDARGKRVRRSTRTSDKAAAGRVASKWESDAQEIRQGVLDPSKHERIQSAGLPIIEHVKAFLAFRATGGGTEDHRERIRSHINEFIASGGWERIADIRADHVTARVAELKKVGASARTIQARLQSVKSFTKWLSDHHRLDRNPLSSIKKPDPKSDRRHERRMLLPSEWPWIRKVLAESSRETNGMAPAERLLLYRLAIQTGLRASEIGELKPGSLKLDAPTPYVLCKAAGTKNRKPAQQFIDQELGADLAAHMKTRGTRRPVFGIDSATELSRTLESDLVEARRLWLEKSSPEEAERHAASDFLCKANHGDEILVFHSLRHSCGAWLAMAGVSPKVIQAVMRHSSITLTMDTYGHLFPGQTEEAPTKIAEIMRTTGDPS